MTRRMVSKRHRQQLGLRFFWQIKKKAFLVSVLAIGSGQGITKDDVYLG
jgi:hypothetical protein